MNRILRFFFGKQPERMDLRLIDYLSETTLFFDYKGRWYACHVTPSELGATCGKEGKDVTHGDAKQFLLLNKDKWILQIK